MNYNDKKFSKEFEELQTMLSKERIELLNNYFKAMANFYYLIPLKKVFSIITEEYNENYSKEVFEKFLALAPFDNCSYYELFSEAFEDETATPTIGWSLAHVSILDFEEVYDNLRNSKAEKEDYYILPKEELLKYAEEFYDPPTPTYNAMLTFVRKYVTDGPNLAEDYVEEMLLSIREGDTMPIESLNCLGTHLDIVFLIQHYERFEELYLDLNNNTRNPHLNGFTPKEYFEKTNNRIASLYTESSDIPKENLNFELDELLKRTQSWANARAGLAAIGKKLNSLRNPALKALPQPEKKKKVGRNDPCPCGSGKKYKKCCGK